MKPDTLKDEISRCLATGFYSGYIPLSPGTFGSVVGAFLLWSYREVFNFYDSIGLYLGLTLAYIAILFLLSVITIRVCEDRLLEHDDKRIVIDEILGVTLAQVAYPNDWRYILITFVLFRFFDILKFGPVRWADKELPGPWGTLLDDVFAGIMTGIAALPALFFLSSF